MALGSLNCEPIVRSTEPPFSAEAEESVISYALLDGAPALTLCEEAGVTAETFYLPGHAEIYRHAVDLKAKGQPVDASTVAESLRAAGSMDRIGGLAFFAQVSARLTTTAQAGFFIEAVRQFALRREAIARGQAVIEHARLFSGATEELIASVQAKFDAFGRRPLAAHQMNLDALLGFDVKRDPDCLMGRRFLGRTGGLVIVAPSGVGKSVLSVQFGGCASLGLRFFGLQMVAPIRVLYVQAEDDTGDVAEAVQGFAATYKLTEADIAVMRERFRIVRWNDAAGAKFLSRLRSEHARHPFDLVIINPLFSFCGCNVSEQSEMSAFLRNGLNPILNDTRAAAIIVHHTNKPPADGKNQPDGNTELRYVGSGSAELTNWARAYITLQAVKSAGDGVFKMSFAKRGTRAGIVDAEGKPTTSVMIGHSPHGLCWVPSEYAPLKDKGGKFVAKFDLARAAEVYDPELDWEANEIAIALDQAVIRKTVRRHQKNILDTV